MAELERQLRFAPAEVRREQVRRAEQFIDEIEPDGRYPEDFVVYRLTEYRPEATASLPVAFEGAELRGDLAVFVSRVTAAAPAAAGADGREPIEPAVLAAEVGVSERTLRRWRRFGLALHHVRVGSAAEPRLVCFRDAWERFRAREPERVARAAAFTRIGPADRERARRLVSEARAGGASAAAAHRSAAEAIGRSSGAIRTMAERGGRGAEASAGPAAGRGPGRRDAVRSGTASRRARFAARADAAGVPVSRIAERLGRSPDSVRRLIRADRARRLRGLDLQAVTLPTFERPDAADVLLVATGATAEEAVVPTVERPVQWLATLTAAPAVEVPAAELDAAAVARAFLLHRASTALRSWATTPSALALDAVETDLRRAGQTLRRLVRALLPAAIGPIEQGIGGRLVHQPADVLEHWLSVALDVARVTAVRHDPREGRRLDRRTAWEAGRRVARIVGDGGPAVSGRERAAARHEVDLDLGLRVRRLDAWSAWLEPDDAAWAAFGGLEASHRRLLAAHEGLPLDGCLAPVPQPIPVLAESGGVTGAAISRRLGVARDAWRLRRNRSSGDQPAQA